MCSFLINLETPSKKNSNKVNFKTRRTYKAKPYQLWHESAKAELLAQKLPATPIDQAVSITLNFTHGDCRRRDSDNGVSSILDLLQDVGILKDDNWQIIRTIHVNNYYAHNAPKCEIKIEKV